MSDAWDPPPIEPTAPAKPPLESPPEPPPLPEYSDVEVNSSADIDLTERQLGDYRLLRRLGRGAMAIVYLAEQCSLHRQVALKLLRSELAEDDTYVRRFHNEARAAAALVHANIVQTHEVGCIDGVHFIAQEYVAGQDLAQLLSRKGPLDQDTAVRIMSQVASALAKAGGQNIVHRDIKPENIMLAQSGELKVADFGLARISENEGTTSKSSAGRTSALNLTQVGMTMGTPLYMSPEQVQGKKLDPRSDLYSFGVTCYHMLVGKPPFEGDTALNVAVQHINNEPEPLEKKRPDLDPALCRIVHRMLAKNPADRYENARELWRELRPLRSELEDDLDDPAASGFSGAAEQYWASDQQRTEAIDRLGTMMLSAVDDQRPRHLWRWTLGLAIVALMIGAAIAWVTRESSVLDGAELYVTGVAAQESAKLQYNWATSLARISPAQEQQQAWQSVLEHFPNDAVYTPRAKLQLAWLALRQQQNDMAMEYFGELSELGDSDAKLRSVGLAGEFIVLSLDEDQRAAQRLQDFSAQIGGLTPAHLKRFSKTIDQTLKDRGFVLLIAKLIQRQQKSITVDESEQWKRFMEENFPAAPAESDSTR
jgi:serine/threonine protein kinase